ncbi:uncharacterized protein LOC119079112 [Bradysia coprophila]|uniref:uncharacterized protein LOC119079112 n=1 Tax=Bradysia coprophila TaxID=38358 RepID=UPI00187DCA2E|nr:uncharacterized protein LOC119079112 [Bradysia coprophila]
MIEKKQRSSITSSLPSSSNKSSLYWSARGSEIATSTRRPSTVRHEYIDPWDLENYVYIHRHAEVSPRPSASPSLAEEPMSSMLYYQSGSSDENCFSCYAGLDEELFYNAKYESIHDEPPYTSSIYYTDLESQSTEPNSASTVSTLQLHTPGFGARASGGIVLPKPVPQIQFPAPPPVHDIYYPNSILQDDDTYCTFDDCYECSNVPVGALNPYTNHYATHRFGLSKKGLLQIDHLYSLNWNNLDRFIGK